MRTLVWYLNLLSVILFCMSLFVGCDSPKNTESEKQQIQFARDAVFTALSNTDSVTLMSHLAKDFVLIHSNGQVSNRETLWRMMKRMRGMGMNLGFTFEDDSIQIEGSAAWMTYRYREVITSPNMNDTLVFLESSVFRRRHNQWKMVLAHYSTLEQGE